MSTPIPSKDGKKLFVIGRMYRGELQRGESESDRFTPFLSGFSGEDVAFSKDGQWMAYVSYPEGILWRSKPDGSEKVKLSYPPLFAAMPRWSPDGKQIAFDVYLVGRPVRIYLVSADGGSPQLLLPGNVAYALPPLNREERAARAKVVISTHFNSKQQAFLDFVLAHYVSVGVEELDPKRKTLT